MWEIIADRSDLDIDFCASVDSDKWGIVWNRSFRLRGVVCRKRKELRETCKNKSDLRMPQMAIMIDGAIIWI